MNKGILTVEGSKRLGVPELAGKEIGHSGIKENGNVGHVWYEDIYLGYGISNQYTSPNDPTIIIEKDPPCQ